MSENRIKLMCRPNLLVLWVVFWVLVRYESVGASSQSTLTSAKEEPTPIETTPNSINEMFKFKYEPAREVDINKLLMEIQQAINTEPQLEAYRQYLHLLKPNSEEIVKLVKIVEKFFISRIESQQGEEMKGTHELIRNLDDQSLEGLVSLVFNVLKNNEVEGAIKMFEEEELSRAMESGELKVHTHCDGTTCKSRYHKIMEDIVKMVLMSTATLLLVTVVEAFVFKSPIEHVQFWGLAACAALVLIPILGAIVHIVEQFAEKDRVSKIVRNILRNLTKWLDQRRKIGIDEKTHNSKIQEVEEVRVHTS